MTAPFLLCFFAFATFGQSLHEQPREILDRAVADFQQSRIAQAVEGFDRVAKLVPAMRRNSGSAGSRSTMQGDTKIAASSSNRIAR
jgi:hypothetical protein